MVKVSFLALIVVLGSAPLASGEDAGTTLAGSNDGAKLSFDNSVEVTSRKGVSGTSSLTVAPYGALDSNAVLLRVEGTGSEYRYTNNDPPPAHVNGRSIDASVLAGLQAVYENFTAAIFLGGNSQSNRNAIDDPKNSTWETKTGVKGVVEVGLTPTDKTSVQGSVSLSRANRSYRVDLKSGYEVVPNVYAGPQAVFQGDAYYQQWKVGVYASMLIVGGVGVGVGAGLLHDVKQGNGVYLQVSTGLRF
jgi:hypothetical protein